MDDEAQVLFFIDKLGINQNVKLAGKVNPADYVKILESNNFYIQTSDSEALSASVLEAQSYGLPAVISNSGGLPETIIDGKTGFTTKPFEHIRIADLIVELFRNEKMYNSFSKEAIKNIKSNFTLDGEIKKLRKLYSMVHNGENL